MNRRPLALLATLFAAIAAGCNTPPQNMGSPGGRIDPTRDADAEIGSPTPRSQDLTAATERMAQDLATRLDVVNRESPPRIVVGKIENNSGLRAADFQVFLVRLRAMLNQSGARHGLEFVREADYVEQQRAREYGGKDPDATPERYRSRADFVLTCEVYDLPSDGADYYLFSYQLVQLREAATGPDVGAGTIIWENMYEVKFQ